MAVDPETQLSQAELDAIRGPYLRFPLRNAPSHEWIRWAREVDTAHALAASVLDWASRFKIEV